MKRRRHAVAMARRPQAGSVKTRLAADLGEKAALAFYARTLRRTLLRLAAGRRWRTTVAVAPAAVGRRRWLRGLPALAQSGGDLGRRMQAAIDAMGPGDVVVVGSDVPALAGRHLARAFRALRRHDAVFGPAGDGGFWLAGVAAGRRRARLFAEGIRWSSPHALADALRGLPAGWRIAMLETLDDIDSGDDFRRWRGRRRHGYGGGESEAS